MNIIVSIKNKAKGFKNSKKERGIMVRLMIVGPFFE